MDDNEFGLWLKDQLRRSDASRKELALVLGLKNSNTIYSWTGGHRHISADNADKVADFFGVPRNVVRELANRPKVSGSVPGLVGLRGSSGLTGVASVAFIPIIGAAPFNASHTAEPGEVMPFAAEYVARFRQPGIITITDDSLAHRGIRRGEGLLVEQEFEVEQIKPGALVILRDEQGHYSVATWYVDKADAVTLVPASEQGPPLRYDPEDRAVPEITGIVKSAYSVRSID